MHPVKNLLAVGLLVLASASVSRAPRAAQLPPPSQPAVYAIRNLGTLCVPKESFGCDAAGSRAFDVNNWGQVVGIAHILVVEPFEFPRWVLRGFRTGANQPMNPLADALGFGGSDLEFRAYSINDAGSVVGAMRPVFITAPGPYLGELAYDFEDVAPAVYPPVTAFLSPPSGGVVPLPAAVLLNCSSEPPPPFGCHQSIAFGINAVGDFVGTAAASPWTSFQAFRFSSAIQSLGGKVARDVNDFGLAVGYTEIGFGFGSSRWSVRFAGGPPEQLGSIGSCSGCESEAHGVNNAAQIVGESDAEVEEFVTRRHAFFLDPALVVAPGGSAMQDLGTLCSDLEHCTSRAFDINDVGLIVGESQVAASMTTNHAFVYRVQDGVMRDLNDLIGAIARTQWVLTDARGVNDLGQIVGTGRFQGEVRAYLLTPSLNVLFQNMKTLLTPLLAAQSGEAERSLRAKLEAAEAAFESEAFDAAHGQLGAFDNQVQALVRSGRLTAFQSTKLIAGSALIQGEMRR